MRVALSVLLVAMVGLVVGPTLALADRIEGQITVSGRDASGGQFWVAVVPGTVQQPLSSDEARSLSVQAVDHRFAVEDLPPGDYLVALVAHASMMERRPPESVRVLSPTGEVTEWPAFRVRVAASGTAPEVVFERKAYPELPEGFVLPTTSEESFASERSEGFSLARNGEVLGASVVVASLLLAGAAMVRRRFA
jgi:hypothetical protein